LPDARGLCFELTLDAIGGLISGALGRSRRISSKFGEVISGLPFSGGSGLTLRLLSWGESLLLELRALVFEFVLAKGTIVREVRIKAEQMLMLSDLAKRREERAADRMATTPQEEVFGTANRVGQPLT